MVSNDTVCCLIMFLLREGFSVERVIEHPNYDTHDHKHKDNLALIKLVNHVDTKKFTPVCLPSFGQTFALQEGVLTGNHDTLSC